MTRLSLEGGYIRVYLSRRNLEQLIANLDNPRADGKNDIEGSGDADTPRWFIVAEENRVHYNHPDRPAAIRGSAGKMGTEEAHVPFPEKLS